jgi:hypothetical protein
MRSITELTFSVAVGITVPLLIIAVAYAAAPHLSKFNLITKTLLLAVLFVIFAIVIVLLIGLLAALIS